MIITNNRSDKGTPWGHSNKEEKNQTWEEDLQAYLIAHESDIADGENDFDELQRVFTNWFGRPPKGR